MQSHKKQANNNNNNSNNNLDAGSNSSATSSININSTEYSDRKNSSNDNRSKAFKVLIVDDDADITVSFKEGLEKEGFEIYAFNDPLEALSKFKEKEAEKNDNGKKYSSLSSPFYDMLLLDVRMPKMQWI